MNRHSTIALCCSALICSAGLHTAAFGQSAPSEKPALPDTKSGQTSITEQQAAILERQGSSSVLATALRGSAVYTSDGLKVGDVSDLLIRADGTLEGVVIGIGGFLGIGATNVAIRMDRVRLTPPFNGLVQVHLDMTKSELDVAPAFRTRADPERPGTNSSR